MLGLRYVLILSTEPIPVLTLYGVVLTVGKTLGVILSYKNNVTNTYKKLPS